MGWNNPFVKQDEDDGKYGPLKITCGKCNKPISEATAASTGLCAECYKKREK